MIFTRKLTPFIMATWITRTVFGRNFSGLWRRRCEPYHCGSGSIKSTKREVRLMVKSEDVATVKMVLFSEEEDVEEEMGEKDKGNQQ
jgi:hypothetical protein